MYQPVMQQALEGCEGVRNIHDDIIVHKKTAEQHDTRLEKALGKIQEKGLTLNKEKCKFHMSEIEFMGYLLSARGIGPTQAKVEAVTEAHKPDSVAEVHIFLGLVNSVPGSSPIWLQCLNLDSQEKMYHISGASNKTKHSVS